MPKEYEKMRDAMKRAGKSDEEAKRMAAATYNKRHPDKPMGRHEGKDKKR